MIFFSLLLFVAAALMLGIALWNALAWPRITTATGDRPQRHCISVLIPARDEGRNLAACLEGALAQGEVVAEVLVYDDHSRDETPAIINDYSGRDARVKSVASASLPPGWCGKTFACARLAATARGEWLLFIDADARLCEDAAARMLAEADARRLTLLSCWPALELRGFWERLLMPLLNFVVFTLYPAPLALSRRTDASLGLAHGACLLVHARTYARLGGHASVRSELFEDVRLAQVWRAGGEAGLCLDGQGVVSVRMYRSLAEIWCGFQKNFFPAFRRESSFWLFMATHSIVLLLPFILAPLFWETRGATVFAVLATVAACTLAMRAVLALRFSHPWWSVVLHPLGETVLLALGLSSWWHCKSGRGVVWKGRRYRAGGDEK